MTRDDIIRMAREAELLLDIGTTFPYAEGTDIGPMLEKFAALVATFEQEACANRCILTWQKHEDTRKAAMAITEEYVLARGNE